MKVQQNDKNQAIDGDGTTRFINRRTGGKDPVAGGIGVCVLIGAIHLERTVYKQECAFNIAERRVLHTCVTGSNNKLAGHHGRAFLKRRRARQQTRRTMLSLRSEGGFER